MKKTLKNIIICICIIYFILSLSSLVLEKGIISENWLRLCDFQSEQETTELKYYYNALQELIETNLIIAGISVLIGAMLGSIISVKESSITKYAVYFVVGFFVYTLLWTGLNYLVNSSYGNIEYMNFIEIYKGILKTPVIISYIILYSTILSGIIIYNKNKVKELNETLKNKENNTKSSKIKIDRKTIKYSIIGIVVLVTVIFVIIIARRTIILIKYSEKISEINNSNNYYIKEEWKNLSTNEKFYKDGIYADKRGDSMAYINLNTKEWLSFDLKDKTMNDQSFNLNDEVNIVNYIIPVINPITYSTKSVLRWHCLLEAFKVNIDTEEIDGRKCYVIQQNKQVNIKSYIDKETFYKVRQVQYDSNGMEQNVVYYTYEIGTVTDEDVAKPVFE